MTKNRLNDLKTIDSLINPIADSVIECFRKEVVNDVKTGKLQLDGYCTEAILYFLQSDKFLPTLLIIIISIIEKKTEDSVYETLQQCMEIQRLFDELKKLANTKGSTDKL